MSARTAIGVDVGGTGTRAAIVDAEGGILARSERPTDPSAGTKGIISVIDDLTSQAPEVTADIVGVGVGLAGFVDPFNGRVNFSPNLIYDDPDVAAAVAARIDVPVRVDNDANVAAWGEHRFGTAKGLEHVVMVTLGTGVGSGFIVEGRIVHGASGAAAELGHLVVDPDGPPCSCGLRGCLEQFASGSAIRRMAAEAVDEDPSSTILSFAGTKSSITARHVAMAAREYDEAARSVLRRAGRALGIGLSNVVNLFDPQVIVLGGGVVKAGEPYLGPARDTLHEMNAAQRRRPTRIDTAVLGTDAGVVGAAALVLEG
ncbi:MAG: ROK family protein [Actinomycetota bacterium]